MKNQKGITMISLIVYIIVMLIVISIIATITSSMTTNLGAVEKTSKDAVKVNKFDMYFLSDIKNAGVLVYDISELTDENKYIILEDKEGNDIQYIFKNNAIYRIENSNTQIQICSNITNFEVNKEADKAIKVKIETGEYISEKNYKVGRW